MKATHSGYDSFVLRLWHDGNGARLLRAEIAHVQSGGVFTCRDVSAEWILQTLRASVRDWPDAPGVKSSDAPGQRSSP
jgi:hypothetical protein